MRSLILLDRHYAISKEEAIWFSSVSPFNSETKVWCVVPEKKSREAFAQASEEFWKNLDSLEEDTLLISTGSASRVIHPDFLASTWMLYHVKKGDRLVRLISLPSSFSFLSKEGLSLFSASQIRQFILSALEKESTFDKVEMLKDQETEIYNLGVFPKPEIKFLREKEVEQIFSFKGKVVLDLETSGLNFYKDQIFTVALHQGNEILVFLFSDQVKPILKEWIEKNLEVLVGAHIKFDVLFLAWNLGNLKELLKKEWLDPLLMVLCLDNSMVRDRGLKSLAARFFHSIDYGAYYWKSEEKEDAKSRWSKIHSFFASLDLGEESPVWEKVFAYSGLDTYWTAELESYLSKQLDSDLRILYKKVLEEPSKLLAEMSYNGLLIDWNLVRERNRLAEEELNRLKKEIFEVTGITNPDSIKQVRDFILENFEKDLPKTKTGNPKVSFDVLESLKDLHPGISLLANYRALRHLNSNFLKESSLKEYSSGERIHPDFNQGAVITGRLSSSNPNLQQLPGKRADLKSRKLSEVYKKVWNVREFIIPESKDHKILEIDLNQAELRGGAFIVQERRMLYGFRTGADLYRLIGERIYQKKASEITKEERIPLKTLLLGLMYGMTAGGVSRIFSVDHKTANKILKETFSLFPKLRRLADQVRKFLDQDTEDVLYVAPTRQRRILEKCGWKADKKWFVKKVFRECFTSAVNFPVQSMTSDWVLRLAIRFKKDFGDKIRILNLVHDSILLDAPEELIPSIIEKFSKDYRHYLLDDEEFFEVMIKRLLRSFPIEYPIIDVPPIRYEAKIGNSWGSAEEVEIPYQVENLPEWTEETKLMVPVIKSEKDREVLDFILVRETGVLIDKRLYEKLPDKSVVYVEGRSGLKFKEWDT